MPTIKKIEDLQVWKEARILSKMLYELANGLPKSEEYNLKRHIKENARGIPANIAEGFYRYFKKERLHLFDITRGCLGEVRNDCYLCYDNKFIQKEILITYIRQINKVGAMLNSFINSIGRRSIR